jgi:(1->4)-alpha-D-glucan 1-alpha-D-glucosylmutase
VFHTIVGAWPIDVERAEAVVTKSLREAKVRTTWTDPDEAYEAAVIDLAARTIREPDLGHHATALVDRIDAAGRDAALAQLLLQLLLPGVPDIYRGSEDWDLSLVDPDNRRPLDPAARAEAVDRPSPRAGLIRAALDARRRHGPDLGAYVPLDVGGADRDRVVAFARGDAPALVVVAGRPGPGASRRADATVALPPGTWRSVLDPDAGPVERTLDLGALDAPLALLEAG